MQQEIPARLTALVKQSFPGWQVSQFIGRGSYSRVYRIHDESGLVRDCALKWVELSRSCPEVAAIERRGSENDVAEFFRTAKQQLQQEIQLLDQMHDNGYIVDMLDHKVLDREDGGFDLLIRMENLTPLSALIDTMTVQDVRQLGLDICSALMGCEAEGIAHRDVKPDNIFRNHQGRYKLGDLGAARRSFGAQGDSTPQGTVLYMAPEVYLSKPYDGKKTDIYSLGLVLYELLNAQHAPFTPLGDAPSTKEEEEASVRRRMSGEDLPAPRQGTREFHFIIDRACSFDPEERYDSAREMYDDLQGLVLLMEGHEKLQALSLTPAAPCDIGSVPGRDGAQDSRRTEKASPGNTNSFSGVLEEDVDERLRNRHPLLSEDDADDAPDWTQAEPEVGGFSVQSVNEELEQEEKRKKARKKRRRNICIAAAAGLVVVAALVFLFIVTGRVSSLQFAQDGFRATVTWRGGRGPWNVRVTRNEELLEERQVDKREAVFQLAPGFDYSFQVADQTIPAAMAELPGYTGGDIKLEGATLQYYLVKAGGEAGRLNDATRIEYTPLVGMEGERGYQLRLNYKMPSGAETSALCFLVAEGFQDVRDISFVPSDFLNAGDIALNEAVKRVGARADELICKIYVGDCLLLEGEYPIVTKD